MSHSFPKISLCVPQINCLYLLSQKKKRLASLQFNLRSQATTHTHRTQPDIFKKFILKEIFFTARRIFLLLNPLKNTEN